LQQTNGGGNKVQVTEIIGGVKLVTQEFNVKVPVFEDVVVKVPKFVDEQVSIPVGYDKVINALALELSTKVLEQVENLIKTKLNQAIDERISTIKTPKIVEELIIKNKEVEVEKPIYKTVEIERPIFVDKEIINPVTKDVEIINAIIIDKPVVNCTINDVHVTNAIIKDVEVERAVIREKVVDVIHPRYLDLKGNPVS
jgi:hypothetical protein